jgi:DUF1365 family protein
MRPEGAAPFIGMGARYHFRILPPGKTVRMPIHETERGEALLSATFIGTAKSLGTVALSGCLLKIPFMTWKIMAGIHWEALKLWLKGARFHRSPPSPSRSATATRVEFSSLGNDPAQILRKRTLSGTCLRGG